ncbi:MAG: excinuclease ABC subunit UvrC [Candidatus Sericytochromatia bacterium]|nr:excinuclease ABC subunit UvrC [Candidatus Sericytochromatia bacterium]
MMNATEKNINLASLPEKPGVYIMYNQENTVIYIGKAINLKNRVRSYFQNRDQGEKVRAMVYNIDHYDYIVTDNEVEALILESTLIKKFKPKYNILLKDDRELPYIKITLKDKYPKILPCRKMIKDGSKYYGPFPTMSSMYEVKALVERMFPVKSCDVPVYKDKPCLYYHLKQCLAPCISWVSTEEHRKMVNEVGLFLEGKAGNSVEKLTLDMEKAAERQDFERAATLRDLVKSLVRYMEKQKIVTDPGVDQDIIGTYVENDIICCEIFQVRNGKLIGKIDFNYEYNENIPLEEFISTFITNYYQKTENLPLEVIVEKEPLDFEIIEAWLSEKKGKKVRINQPYKGRKKELMELVIKNAMAFMDRLKSDHSFNVSRTGVIELKKYLNMNVMPRKIEGFDISHTQGTNTVSSMVVFENGKPKKSEYRKFKINFSEGEPNDYASMYEVIYRRYKRVLMEGLEQPDLILIDGGKGQLSSAIKALDDLSYPYKAVIGLAKRLEEVFIPDSKTPIILKDNSYALILLQQVRDEAHRFAIDFHRKLRGQKMTKSFLDDISGIGSVRKKKLMETFGSMDKISKASLNDLVNIGKLPKNIAEELHTKFAESRT